MNRVRLTQSVITKLMVSFASRPIIQENEQEQTKTKTTRTTKTTTEVREKEWALRSITLVTNNTLSEW